jgi:2-hydroxychromene-2-carboxylate isomerase
MAKNNLRKAAILGIPLRPPAHHPFNPLLAVRLSSLPLPSESRHALIDALFRSVWVRELHMSETSTVERVMNELGLDDAALVAEADSAESKARLRRQTDDAIALGVFGVPSMYVRGELFWGYDDFPHLERFLTGNDPLDPAELQRWLRPVRPSAVRRRFRPANQGD